MSTLSNPRLLVVDDDLGVIAAYRHVLEGSLPAQTLGNDELEDELFGQANNERSPELDWRVHFVDQGEDAVEAVRQAMTKSDPFTVVFLDIRMPPGIDGHETARQIRAIDPNVHVVFVSAYSDYTQEELSEAAAPTHRTSFLPKPVWPDQLKSAALGLCREAQLRALLKVASQERKQARKTST